MWVSCLLCFTSGCTFASKTRSRRATSCFAVPGMTHDKGVCEVRHRSIDPQLVTPLSKAPSKVQMNSSRPTFKMYFTQLIVEFLLDIAHHTQQTLDPRIGLREIPHFPHGLLLVFGHVAPVVGVLDRLQ
jgi:hypothetical protein